MGGDGAGRDDEDDEDEDDEDSGDKLSLQRKTRCGAAIRGGLAAPSKLVGVRRGALQRAVATRRGAASSASTDGAALREAEVEPLPGVRFSMPATAAVREIATATSGQARYGHGHTAGSRSRSAGSASGTAHSRDERLARNRNTAQLRRQRVRERIAGLIVERAALQHQHSRLVAFKWGVDKVRLPRRSRSGALHPPPLRDLIESASDGSQLDHRALERLAAYHSESIRTGNESSASPPQAAARYIPAEAMVANAIVRFDESPCVPSGKDDEPSVAAMWDALQADLTDAKAAALASHQQRMTGALHGSATGG